MTGGRASGLINDDLSTLEADVRLANGREIAILGALAAGIVLLVRLTQRSQKRKEMHDTAVATLTESGEFFRAGGKQAGERLDRWLLSGFEAPRCSPLLSRERA